MYEAEHRLYEGEDDNKGCYAPARVNTIQGRQYFMFRMRLGWYAGVSTALAGAVVVSAFQQRANFYSAMVYLAQSNFCLLTLVNFTLLLYSSFIYGLTKLCYGTLRTVEVEQLTERAWFAITETCLAMTIFREEIGAWFLAMFTALVTGKLWGWIGDGRVEFLEQQPPANPTLFHLRLSVSLAMSFIYDVLILKYAVNTVIQQARPNMMVMFLFEFAVLATCSWRTGVRYILSIAEQKIVQAQTKQRLSDRRQEIRQQRQDIIREREQAAASGEDSVTQAPLPNEDDVDEIDIEVPGWSAKGEWVLWLDLVTDMIKLGIYVAFFCMLLKFYGLPIHIMRDLFITSRDFIKRLNALIRYRRAIQEMNRYPDATVEELAQENTCIICREEMRPWNAENQQTGIDRVRPKKLPCGHVLHLGCLKSWLERQQVCPTCRRPVSFNSIQGDTNRVAGLRIQIGGVPQLPNGQQQAGANNNAAADQQAPNLGQAAPPGREGGPRVFNLGPIRLGFGANANQAREIAQQFGIMQNPGNNQANTVIPGTQSQPALANNLQQIGNLLQQTDQLIQRELQGLQTAEQELQVANLLAAELQRVRQRRLQQQDQRSRTQPAAVPVVVGSSATVHMPQNHHNHMGLPPHPHYSMGATIPGVPSRNGSPLMTRHSIPSNSVSLPAGSPELPDGVTLPPGWSLIPLQRLEGPPAQPRSESPSSIDPSSQGETINAGHPTPQPAAPSSSEAPAREAQLPAGGSAGDATASDSDHHPAASTAALNWGGSSQLFTAQHRSGSVGSPAKSSVPPSSVEGRDEAQQASSSQQQQAASENGKDGLQARELHPSDDAEGTSALRKGKARAVTIEEAADNEGNE